MPTDIEMLQFKSYLNGEQGAELSPAPQSVYVPIMLENGHCILIIIKTNNWTLEVYDAPTKEADIFKSRAALAKKKVWTVLAAIAMYYVLVANDYSVLNCYMVYFLKRQILY